MSRVRAAAAAQDAGLRNFVCREIVTRSRKPPSKHDPRRRLDTQILEISYTAEGEKYEFVADKTNKLNRQNSPGFTPPGGEFASYLKLIFDPAANTWFTWEAERLSNGNDICLFRYQVPEVSSTFFIKSPLGEFRLGHHGVIYVDRASGQLLRLELETDAPRLYTGISQALTLGRTLWIDYQMTVVSGVRFMLPQRAAESDTSEATVTKYDIVFDQCRKYVANSEFRTVPLPQPNQPN